MHRAWLSARIALEGSDEIADPVERIFEASRVARRKTDDLSELLMGRAK
jgi:hypothetical protein